MEIEIRQVVVSEVAIESIDAIYQYVIETFSFRSATVFVDELIEKIYKLDTQYLYHPPCRFLPTKTNIYRNFAHGQYVVIYRVTQVRIEILNIIHSSRSPAKMKAVRKIHL